MVSGCCYMRIDMRRNIHHLHLRMGRHGGGGIRRQTPDDLTPALIMMAILAFLIYLALAKLFSSFS